MLFRSVLRRVREVDPFFVLRADESLLLGMLGLGTLALRFALRSFLRVVVPSDAGKVWRDRPAFRVSLGLSGISSGPSDVKSLPSASVGS